MQANAPLEPIPKECVASSQLRLRLSTRHKFCFWTNQPQELMLEFQANSQYDRGLEKNGTTIFLTTHYIEEAERICDRIAFITEGQIVASGTVSQLMDSVSHGHAIQFVTDKDSGDVSIEPENHFIGSKVEIRSNHSLVMLSEQRIPLFRS